MDFCFHWLLGRLLERTGSAVESTSVEMSRLHSSRVAGHCAVSPLSTHSVSAFRVSKITEVHYPTQTGKTNLPVMVLWFITEPLQAVVLLVMTRKGEKFCF